ncbi:MAG: hypothetical protein ABR610_04920 [Thermoanaerobaculia bacterium]
MGRRFTSSSRDLARETLFAFLFFAASAVLFTWPLAARLTDGMVDIWDGKLTAWIFHWDFHQIFRDPLRLFDANIFHPARYALAFSENLFGAAVFGFPLYASGASSLLAGNVLLLAGMAFSGVAGWALAREVTGDSAASLLGGVVYAFVPWRLAQLPHVQFQWGAFLALLLLFLLRYLDRGARRDAVLFSLCFAWNALTNVHYAIFSGFLVALVLAHSLATLPGPLFRKRLTGVAFAVAVAVVVVLPFYVPYAKATRLYGLERSEGEIAFYSAHLIDFFTSGPQNKLYAGMQKFAHAEGDLFPGLVPLGLAAAAIFFLRRRSPATDIRAASAARRRAALVLDGVVLLGVLLWALLLLRGRPDLGPVRVRDPGRILFFVSVLLLARAILAFPASSRFAGLADFLRRTRVGSRPFLMVTVGALGILVALGTRTPVYRFVVQSAGPALRAIRVPARGIVLSHLGLAVLASWGLAMLSPRARRWPIAAALLLTAFEYRAFPIEIFSVRAEPAPVYRWLAVASVPGAAVEWPINNDIEPEHVFRSTTHWKPLLNGYSGFGPPDYLGFAALLSGEAVDDRVWNAMRRLDASVLVFHPAETTDEDRAKYLSAVRRGISQGRIIPMASFTRPGTETRDFVFRFQEVPAFDGSVPPATALHSPAEALRQMADLELRLAPPFGVVERPREDEVVGRGYWAFGWALDDSGIARVRLFAPNAPPVECIAHQPFPGVAAAYPKNPESGLPGYGCPVPALPHGPRVLSVEITGRDGGVTILRRAIRVP